MIAAAVQAALGEGRPVVALESSVLAQGLPIPANREAERRMRAAILTRGAVPAITAVVRGAITVGLDGPDLERFLLREGVTKVSARDLPVAVAQKLDGATTVAASLACCVAAGLGIFATGGIGGVHRDAPYDESADLVELGRSPVIVVCAGAKSILDLPATLERLESLGVTVVGYRTSEFPGFFTARTGLAVPARVDERRGDRGDRARRARAGPAGRAAGGPTSSAADALGEAEVEAAVAGALVAARTAGVRGAALTPHLLAAVEAATGGRSLRANLALLESNAALAAEIAVAGSNRGDTWQPPLNPACTTE